MPTEEKNIDILIVEDEPAIARLMEIHLQRAGYKTQICDDGHKAQASLGTGHYRLLLLDRMIPGIRGLDLLRWIRKQDVIQGLPVIMVTALGQIEERVRGLQEGADDYLPKPFEPEELLARVQALLRRSQHAEGVSPVSVVTLDDDAMQAHVAGQCVDLRPLEFRLLQVLMKKPEKVRSRDYLLDKVWGINNFVEERTVDVTVKRLRQALETYGLGECVVTVRGAGYRFVNSKAV